MGNKFVGPGGSDANAGTSYALRWLTVSKAIGATAAAAAGDVVYFTPGTYREVISLGGTWASDVTVIGDVDGSHTSGVPGDVIFSAYTTNDTTAPSATTLLNTNSKNHISFANILFVNGTANNTVAIQGTETNLTFTDCAFYQFANQNSCINHNGLAFGVNAAILFDRCIVYCTDNCFHFIMTRGATVDYDCGVTIRNCFLYSQNRGVFIESTGAGAKFGGGIDMLNCTVASNQECFRTGDSSQSTTTPHTVNNCLLITNTPALVANTAGQITEDYCVIAAGNSTKRTNVTAGTHSKSDNSYAMLLHMGQELKNGQYLRPFLSPMASSPLLGFGSTGAPSVDALNRPRPAGGASIVNAVGMYERHDTAAKETGTTDAGSVAINITGPGDQDVQIPVDTTSTTITVRSRYDSTYTTATKPQAQLLANNELGYAGQTVTGTAAVDTWETLTFSAFTPSAKGVVTLRLISRSAAGGGKAFFDSVVVA